MTLNFIPLFLVSSFTVFIFLFSFSTSAVLLVDFCTEATIWHMKLQPERTIPRCMNSLRQLSFQTGDDWQVSVLLRHYREPYLHLPGGMCHLLDWSLVWFSKRKTRWLLQIVSPTIHNFGRSNWSTTTPSRWCHSKAGGFRVLLWQPPLCRFQSFHQMLETGCWDLMPFRHKGMREDQHWWWWFGLDPVHLRGLGWAWGWCSEKTSQVLSQQTGKVIWLWSRGTKHKQLTQTWKTLF